MTKFLFNTTFTVDIEIANGFLRWMKEIYLPSMTAVAPEAQHELYSVDGSLRDGSKSFSSQWRCSSIRDLGGLRLTNQKLCQEMAETHGEKCLAFSTLMKGETI